MASRNPQLPDMRVNYVQIDKLIRYAAPRLRSKLSNGRHECCFELPSSEWRKQWSVRIRGLHYFLRHTAAPIDFTSDNVCRANGIHILRLLIEIFFILQFVHFSWRRRRCRRALFMRLIVMKYLHCASNAPPLNGSFSVELTLKQCNRNF